MVERAPPMALHHLPYLNLSHGSRRTKDRGRHFGFASPHDVELRTSDSGSIQSPPARTVLKWYMLTGCVCCGVIVGNYYFPATVSQPVLPLRDVADDLYQGPMWKEVHFAVYRKVTADTLYR